MPFESHIKWTNKSVLQLGSSEDPVQTVVDLTRKMVLEAQQNGWQGPPFDPTALARMQGLMTVPLQNVEDARLRFSQGRGVIEFNPMKSPARIKYSVAHEIAHTLFPDWKEQTRHRGVPNELQDNWQLEMLCNLAAAEILMPAGGSQDDIAGTKLGIDEVLSLRKSYAVSTEAILIRVVNLTSRPALMFVARRTKSGSYSLEYTVPSRRWHSEKKPRIPADSAVAECTALGYTSKSVETWLADVGPCKIECVAIGGYPGELYPRVAGLVVPVDNTVDDSESLRIRYVKGNALEPRSTNRPTWILHVVNDATPNWGGRGVAMEVKRRWPHVQESFKRWFMKSRKRHGLLGSIHVESVSDNVSIVSLVAQKGYGESTQQRLRYAALYECLEKVSFELPSSADVQMPRIGAGQAGGNWEVIQEIVDCTLCANGHAVTVVDFPRD